MKHDFHFWCDQVASRFPNTDEARLMKAHEQILVAHNDIAYAVRRPGKNDGAKRSFYDCVGGMRQIGMEKYDLYDDFVPHLVGRSNPTSIFLWATVKEGCERYGRTRVAQAPSIGVNAPTPRTPQEWKWGPQNTLLTPATKKVTYKGSVLRYTAPGVYVVPEVQLTVRTNLSDPEFRSYMRTTSGKLELVKAVGTGSTLGAVVHVR